MKNFSIAVRTLALATGFCSIAVQAATPVTTPTAQCQFLANAPDQHVVVKGDTLWDISGRFLENPWCWPQVWGLNREQIRNPHWIYPGQTVVFDRASGKLRIGQAAAGNDSLPEVRLSPHVRTQSLERQPIASIPAAAIEPFLGQMMVLESAALQSSPRVVAAEDARMNAARGEKIFVRGDLKGSTEFRAFRQTRTLTDPVTKAVLGQEMVYLGAVRLERAARADDEAHRFIVTSTRQEIGIGAYLIPASSTLASSSYAPHAPAAAVDARVVSIYEGLTQAGRNDIVAINRGLRDGVDAGTVLQVARTARLTVDISDTAQDGKNRASNAGNLVKLPGQNYGTLFVFRAFDRVSYGLIMHVTDAVRVNDLVRSPE